MYGNYGRDDQYGGRSMYDYGHQQPNRGYSQAQQYDGQQSWGGNHTNSGRPAGPANMASPWDGGPASRQDDMMSRNYHQLGQSRQSSYNAPHDNNRPNALPDDKAARAYEFLAKVDEDQKRKEELEEQKREVQRLRDEVKKSMETLQHLQGGVGRDGGMGGGWPSPQPPQQQQANKGPVKSILKKPKPLGAQEDEQPRTNYCDVCSIQFNTTREYQQHCAGLLHTKQLMQKKMGISMDKEKAEEPRPTQDHSWAGGNQRGPMGNPPVDLNAIYSAFEDYDDDDGKAQMSQNKPQYVEGGNVLCKICGSTFYTNEEMRSHSATEEHCRKYLTAQNSIGTDKFLAKYGENVFGMAVKYVAAMVDRHIRTDLSGRDLKTYKEFITRSGVVNAYQCRICQTSTFMMEHWIAHCAGKKHTRTCMTKMLSMSSEAYLEEFGDVPGPAPSKTIDSRAIQKWESVFILEALKAVPKMSLIQEQQVAENLQQSRQQQPYGMNPQGMNQTDRNQMDRNQPGAPYQQGRNQPGGNPAAITQQTPPPKGLLRDAPGVLEQLQARYEQQKKEQAMTESKVNDYGHKEASPSARAYDQQDRGGYGQSRDFGDFRDQRGPRPLPGRQPGPPMDMPYNRPPHQDRGYDMDPRHPDDHAAPYENPFNQPSAAPHRNTPDRYGQMPPPRSHPSDRFERDRNIPGLELSRSPYDQGREPPRHDQGREPPRHDQGREPPRHDQGREPPRHDQGREPPRHDNQSRDREYGRDDRRNSGYGQSLRDRPPHDRPPHDRSPHDRSSSDRSSHERSMRDNKDKPSQSNKMYDPFESDAPPAAAPPAAAGDGDKGVVPTAKALQMLHQIQEKQRMEQEKLEKQLKEQQRQLEKQRKEMERERQKHQQELEKREKALKERQQKLEDEKREEERKRKEKEKELEKERNLRLEEKRRQLQMKDDLERKRLQRQREELERKRKEKEREEEDRKKKDEKEKQEELLKQQKLKEELQRKVQEEMESKRQEKLKKEIEERVKQAELQKLKDKEMELDRLVNAKKMELQQNNAVRPQMGQKAGRGRGGWRPVSAPGQFTPAAMPVARNPIPSHLIAVPRSMVGTHMGMRPAFPVSMAGTLMPPGVAVTSVPQQGLIHGAPWHVPPPVLPQTTQAPWNKAQPNPKAQQQTAKPTPATGAQPPWSAAKAGKQADAGKKPQGKEENKSSDTKGDMPWKRKDDKDKTKESGDVPWKRKDDRSQDSSRDMPWKRKDKDESSRDRSSRRDEKRDSRGSSRERDSARSRDAPWQSDRSRDRGRDQRSSEEDRVRSGSRGTPPNIRNEAPWHSKKDEKAAPWESSNRRSESDGVAKDAPWASRRGGSTGGRPVVEKGHTYKLVLTERDQHSWKVAQADFIRCMDSGENTARPLKVFTNTLQSHMRRIQDAKDQLPEKEILATLSTEEEVVTKQIQQMTGLEPISVVTCTLHLLQAMDPRVFNILGTMDPNFMQSLISDAMAGGSRGNRGGERQRSRSRSPSRRDRDTRDSRDAPPWLRGVKRPTDQPESDKRSRWA